MSDLEPTRPDFESLPPETPPETAATSSPVSEDGATVSSPPPDDPIGLVEETAGDEPEAMTPEREPVPVGAPGVPDVPATSAEPVAAPEMPEASAEPVAPAEMSGAPAGPPAASDVPEASVEPIVSPEIPEPPAGPDLEGAAPADAPDLHEAGELPEIQEPPAVHEAPEPHETHESHAERAAANLALLAAEIERLSGLQGRAFWDHVKNVNALFKSLRPVVAEERKKLWDDFSVRCEKARVERAEWNHLADQNARTLEGEIEALGMDHYDGSGVRYIDFWDHTRRVREQFKTLAPLRREDRRKLWERFKGVCAATRKRQNEAMAGRKSHSHQMRASVEALLAEARGTFETAADSAQFNAIRTLLNRAMEIMRGAGKAPEERMVRPDAKACWEEYKELSNAVRRRTESLWDESYAAIKTQALAAAEAAATESPLEAQAKIKELQIAMRSLSLDKSRREEIRRILSEAWVAASHRIQEERDDRRRRRDEWIQRSEERIRGWEDLIRKNEGIIASLESQIQDLDRQIDEAWNESWADRAKGWVEEKRIKVEDIRATNTDVAERIQLLRAKLPAR